MKKIIIMFLVGLVATKIVEAQGTTYLSNLGDSSTGSSSIGSDSWLAADVSTGNNIGGYTFNSIQLALTDASDNPSGFTVMVYGQDNSVHGSILPGSSLGTLTGSLSPVTGGIYTYTTASSLTLLPRTDYFIVLTAGTAIANGA